MVLSLPVIAQTYLGQIQNGGFENWTSTTLFETPDTWFTSNEENWQGIATTTKSSDASDGLYSIEITAKEVGPNPDTTFGYFLHGNIGSMGPDGGIPYTDVFDEVTFDYKSDLPVGDTVFMVIIRFSSGIPVEQILAPAAFGTNGSWTAGSIPVTTTPQTELFIGFVLGDPFNSNAAPTPDVWGRIDNVVLKNSSTPTTTLPNHSFENWTPVATEDPDFWSTMNPLLAPQELSNVVKSTDANSGTYAAELTTIYNPQWDDTIGGIVLLGMFDFNGANPFIPAPYNGTPTSFNYSYKYAPSNNDPSGGIMVQFFSGGSIIGFDVVNATPQATYTTSTLPLTYIGTPDSVMVGAFSGDSLGSVMHVDDFSFSGGNVGLAEFEQMDVSFYPNPATTHFFIKNEEEDYRFELVDLTGKVVKTGINLNGAQQIDIYDLNSGVYILKVFSGNKTFTEQLIVQ